MIYTDSYLEHYGVKGMKWHQHKFGNDPDASILKTGSNAAYYTARKQDAHMRASTGRNQMRVRTMVSDRSRQFINRASMSSPRVKKAVKRGRNHVRHLTKNAIWRYLEG